MKLLNELPVIGRQPDYTLQVLKRVLPEMPVAEAADPNPFDQPLPERVFLQPMDGFAEPLPERFTGEEGER